MSKEVQEATATASESVAQYISANDAIQARTKKLEARAKPAPVKQQNAEAYAAEPEVHSQEQQEQDQEREDTPEVSENTSEEQSSKAEKDVNWDELTDEEIAEMATKGKSRLLKRVAQLTAKAKLAEEQARQAQAQLQQRLQQPQDLKRQSDPEKNPYNNLKTVDELQKAVTEAEEAIEWADDVLWQSEHLAADDVVVTYNGKELTKAQVRSAKKQAEKARKELIPSRLQELQAIEQRRMHRKQLDDLAKQELNWSDEEEADDVVFYKGVMEGPIFKKILEKVPESEAYLPYLAKHAARSIKGRKEIPLTESKKPAVKPPSISTPSGGAGTPDSLTSRKMKELKSRAVESGSIKDFEALAAARIAKNRKLSL